MKCSYFLCLPFLNHALSHSLYFYFSVHVCVSISLPLYVHLSSDQSPISILIHSMWKWNSFWPPTPHIFSKFNFLNLSIPPNVKPFRLGPKIPIKICCNILSIHFIDLNTKVCYSICYLKTDWLTSKLYVKRPKCTCVPFRSWWATWQ